MSNERKEFLQDDGQLRVFIVPVDIMNVQNLTIYEQMTYMVLRSYVNPTDPTAFPSYATIAKRGRMSRSSAIRAVEGLAQKGLIKKEIRLDVSKNRKIRNTSNMYTLITPKPEGNKGVVSHRHQGGECLTDTTPSVSQTPPLVSHRHHPQYPTDTLSKSFRTESLRTMIDRLIDSESLSLREFLNKTQNLKPEHVEAIAEINQVYITHPGFTESLLIEKITTCLKTYKRSFKACLRKSIENELNKPTKSVKQRAKAKKPAIPIVQQAVEQTGLTDEELQRILNKARKLDEKFKS
jgi:rubrerythrin